MSVEVFLKLLRSTVSSIALKIEELQEALRKKEEEMKQMEERYKKYLEKAKSVSVSLRVSLLSDRGSLTSRDTRLNHDLSDHEETGPKVPKQEAVTETVPQPRATSDYQEESTFPCRRGGTVLTSPSSSS